MPKKENQFSFAKLEVAKARCRVAIKDATLQLAMLDILARSGGEMKALDLVEYLIKYFEDFERDPQLLCKQIGYAPDEVVSLEQLV